ncbi:MAG: carbohydrate kinase family protein [gamma proteobacterium symbiont of Bathyaustriella thionipta]|nr:carbohydrate kinase family protein [gamma proteobacterium symbiont of Bathyaustriella thionipta]
MTALICGSMAFDNIMVFPDKFKNHILPDQVHILNVCFLVPEMRRNFGGCAGNIAYNLKLLGGDGAPMATVGADFSAYAKWLDECGIRGDYLLQVEGHLCAQAYITTDEDDNQITAFHPGAMNESHQIRVADAENISLGIISPDGRQGMLDHARQFSEAGIPFIFDPGQGLPMFDGEELQQFIRQAEWVCCNDYEAKLMQERTGLSPEQIAQQVSAMIVTRGSRGSLIYTATDCLEIPAVPVRDLLDPTGCGDAYRAGLIYGLMNELDWQTTGRIAALMGGIKIEHYGTQNHSFDKATFARRYQQVFASELSF